ncbi:MAG: hypothetical protein ABH812_01530 [bacterium]
MFLTNTFVYAQGIQEWGDCVSDGVPTLKCLEVVFGNIIFAASTFIIIILFIMFIVGSFSYLTSAGNPERVKKAQSTIKFAIIGFVLFLFAFLILRTIDFLFLGGQGSLFKLNIGQ